VGDDPTWEEKTEDRMLWRGKNTGIYFKDGVPWSGFNLTSALGYADYHH
jgi:hypothetical protein